MRDVTSRFTCVSTEIVQCPIKMVDTFKNLFFFSFLLYFAVLLYSYVFVFYQTFIPYKEGVIHT